LTRDGPRVVGVALLAALAASQAALVVLNPLLPDVATDLGISVATAGQLRTVSGLAAGFAALTAGLWAARLGLRELLLGGVATLALGSLLSAAATVSVLYALRLSVWFTVAAFAALSFIAGGRTLAGSARGLGLAPELRLGVTGVRTAALQSGYFVGAAVGGIALAWSGYSAVGLAFALLFVGAAIPHVLRGRSAPR
jgi:predicted MFS family arabinose efflux permease